jgi:AcrR family transcriptional regulator
VSQFVDRRAQKKKATYRAISETARRLTLEKGLDGVTIEDIADGAGVSPRTFFNYFSCKEEAIVGAEPAIIQHVAAMVETRPDGEDPLDALLAVLSSGDTEAAERWKERTHLASQYPELLPRYLAVAGEFERALTSAIAKRLGTDPVTDPYPRLVVATAVATMRSTFEWWQANHKPGRLEHALRQNFGALSAGLGRPSQPNSVSTAEVGSYRGDSGVAPTIDASDALEVH